MLPQVRMKRITQVREFAVKALGPVDPEMLSAPTKVLDQSVQQKAVNRYGAHENLLTWVSTPRTDRRAHIRRQAPGRELSR